MISLLACDNWRVFLSPWGLNSGCGCGCADFIEMLECCPQIRSYVIAIARRCDVNKVGIMVEAALFAMLVFVDMHSWSVFTFTKTRCSETARKLHLCQSCEHLLTFPLYQSARMSFYVKAA